LRQLGQAVYAQHTGTGTDETNAKIFRPTRPRTALWLRPRPMTPRTPTHPPVKKRLRPRVASSSSSVHCPRGIDDAGSETYYAGQRHHRVRRGQRTLR
jgi:hypothetical protein